jgi:hypothetical protein
MIPIFANFFKADKNEVFIVFTVLTISKRVTLPLSDAFYRIRKSFRVVN